jgi:hypothetical protein
VRGRGGGGGGGEGGGGGGKTKNSPAILDALADAGMLKIARSHGVECSNSTSREKLPEIKQI